MTIKCYGETKRLLSYQFRMWSLVQRVVQMIKSSLLHLPFTLKVAADSNLIKRDLIHKNANIYCKDSHKMKTIKVNI